jgi:hypothetical protein
MTPLHDSYDAVSSLEVRVSTGAGILLWGRERLRFSNIRTSAASSTKVTPYEPQTNGAYPPIEKNCDQLDQCIILGAHLRCARADTQVCPTFHAASTSHGASLSLSRMMQRTRTNTTAIEYIQQAANRTSIAQSIDGAILKLLAVKVAP